MENITLEIKGTELNFTINDIEIITNNQMLSWFKELETNHLDYHFVNVNFRINNSGTFVVKPCFLTMLVLFADFMDLELEMSDIDKTFNFFVNSKLYFRFCPEAREDRGYTYYIHADFSNNNLSDLIMHILYIITGPVVRRCQDKMTNYDYDYDFKYSFHPDFFRTCSNLEFISCYITTLFSDDFKIEISGNKREHRYYEFIEYINKLTNIFLLLKHKATNKKFKLPVELIRMVAELLV